MTLFCTYVSFRESEFEKLLKLFQNFQKLSDLLKDKPVPVAGGNGKKGRTAKSVKDKLAPATKEKTSNTAATSKTQQSLWSITFLSSVIHDIYRYARFMTFMNCYVTIL